METSDSDYFESADEDILSDVESPEKASKTAARAKETLCQKPQEIQTNLVKLTLEEGTKNTTLKPEKPQEPKVNQEMKSLSLNNNQNEELDNNNSNISPENPETKRLNLPSEQQQNILTAEEPTEENLWDDDELDWGSEAAKEELEKPKTSTSISKNEALDEASDWGNFEADWESSSESNKEQLSTTNTTLKESVLKKEWENDEWESVEKPIEDNKKETEASWGTWGGWGVSSLLSTATQSVSSLTNHVSQGLSTVLENSIGIPQAEELAKINSNLEIYVEESSHEENTPTGFGLGSLVKFVETTGSKVITGGLDTLEAIGKKTVEVLQEGDPGLKKKRAFLKLDNRTKPNLSQVLREAKEKAEQEPQEEVKKKKFKNYETLFDDHQGLVHLEALEMLSRLCSIKLDNLNNSLMGEALVDMQETLDQVKELCELPEEEEENEKIPLEKAQGNLTGVIKELNVPITFDKFIRVWEEASFWLENVDLSTVNDEEIHQQAIDSLAQLTAICVEQFHKAGELLMVKEHRSTADEADSLVQITTITKALILQEAESFTEKLSSIDGGNKDRINDIITNIFFEAGNSSSYIQDAFQLLIPVLQVGAV